VQTASFPENDHFRQGNWLKTAQEIVGWDRIGRMQADERE